MPEPMTTEELAAIRDRSREIELVDAVEVLVRQALDTTEEANDAM